jgi:hypothetical protein
MVRRKVETLEPVTMGHIRGHGCRELLVYCNSNRCHHSATINADWLSDETPVRSLCRRMVCTKCGMIGADVRPDWSPHVNRSCGPRHPTKMQLIRSDHMTSDAMGTSY